MMTQEQLTGIILVLTKCGVYKTQESLQRGHRNQSLL